MTAALVAVLPGAARVASAPPPARHPPVAAGAGCVTRECHARLPGQTARDGAGSVHQPAAAGECVACHDLALAPGTRFVRGAPAGGGEGPAGGRGWDQALCLGCHGEEPFAGGSPPGATAFADGSRNLHALHVQAGRGRRCLTCHEAHASRQARLLRELLPSRGSARIPQEFRGEPQGGWCRTGCHAPKGYRR
jgi:predicted CXXCH cytochrome family protein